MLNLGIILSSSISECEVLNKKYYEVGNGKLIACFDSGLTNEVVIELAKKKPDFCVFRDSSFSTDAIAINAEQIFKTYSPATTLKTL